MVNVPRIHCHSAYKHYHMFHNNSGSSYGNSVFNTTYNFNGGTMCGGGFWGGLLGGFGMGLGAGLMNLFGGLFGGGMFGGGMSFGFPMFGGGLWGGYGGGSRVGDGAGGKDKSPKVKEKIVEKECKDKDGAIINKLRVELNTLKAKDNITQEEITALHAKIKKAKADSDEHHKVDDDKAYDLLLEDIGILKPKTKEVVTPPPVTPNNNDAITINNNKLTLHFARNEKAGIDKTIQGNVIGIKRNTSNQIESYVIKCKSGDADGNTFGLVYLVEPNDTANPTSYTVTCLSTTHNAKKSDGKSYTLYKKENGITYKLNESTGFLESENGDEVNITTSNKDKNGKVKPGYVKIAYKDDAEEETLESLGLQGYDSVDDYNLKKENGVVVAEKK